MSYAIDKDGLSNQIGLWIQRLKFAPGHTYKVCVVVASNGNIHRTIVREKNKPDECILTLIKVDIHPVIHRLKQRLLRFDSVFRELEVVISTNMAGQVIDGSITIRSVPSDA